MTAVTKECSLGPRSRRPGRSEAAPAREARRGEVRAACGHLNREHFWNSSGRRAFFKYLER